MSETDDHSKKVVHKIGCTRTIQSAVLVVEYLALRIPEFHRDRFSYFFTEPTQRNGWWSADICITTYGDEGSRLDKRILDAVEICRAFIAGRGEVWA